MPIYKTGKQKDGKCQYRVFVSYKVSDGTYRKKSKLIYGAAEAKYAESVMQHQLAEAPDPKNITLREAYEEYIARKAHEVRETSLCKTKSIMKTHILNTELAEKKLKDINAAAISAWKDVINSKQLLTTSKNNAYRELRTLINYCVKNEYILRSPLTSVGPFREAYFISPQEKLRYYTPEQFIKFIAEARRSEKDRPYYTFFMIAYYTGMRKGEINALRWTDREDNIFHVRRSISQKIKGKKVVETPPKNKSSYRDLQIPRPLQVALDQQLEVQKKKPRFNINMRICGGIETLSDSMIELKNKEFATAAGLPHIRIHDFRHSHASLLVNEGVNIQEVARRLGHSKVEITWSTYAHLYPREEEKAVAILDSIQ